MLLLLSLLSLAPEATPAPDASEPKSQPEGPTPATPPAAEETEAPAPISDAAALEFALSNCKGESACLQALGLAQVRPILKVEPHFPAKRHGDYAQCTVRMFINQSGEVVETKIEPNPQCIDAYAAQVFWF